MACPRCINSRPVTGQLGKQTRAVIVRCSCPYFQNWHACRIPIRGNGNGTTDIILFMAQASPDKPPFPRLIDIDRDIHYSGAPIFLWLTKAQNSSLMCHAFLTPSMPAATSTFLAFSSITSLLLTTIRAISPHSNLLFPTIF